MRAEKQKAVRRIYDSREYYCIEDGFILSLKYGYPHVLRASVSPDRYYTVTVRLDGKPFYALTHQLVWLFFKGEFDPALQINHLNGIKRDNRISNLEVVTASENQLHSYRTGLAVRQNGSENHAAKLVEGDVVDIRERCAGGELQKDLAVEYGVSRATVNSIIKKKIWRHV